ncbi:MAG TPA: helix-turn-helix domain-containing protein [Thermoanaerobaculales bacterium]|nr:helix-turn-helix domain-containing protein [Thermoanaerobaculales bacterium]HQP43405.1 helix-turn-helix domain-containing protein [Thermoanaerobaculales bacterium]
MTATMTPEEARRELVKSDGRPAFARGTWYRLLASGTVPAVRCGRRYVVPVEAFREWLASGGRGLPGSGWRRGAE